MNAGQAAVFLDTSVIVDLVTGEIGQSAEAQLAGFQEKAACEFSRLEYKRVVIKNLELLLRYIEDSGSFFAAYTRATRLRSDRRTKTLVNLLSWVESEFDREIEVKIGSSLDKQLAQKASIYLDNAIEAMWYEFDARVDRTEDGMQCRRAAEPPVRKKSGKIVVTVHEASCRDRTCNNANFFRAMLPQIKELLEQLAPLRDRLIADGDPRWSAELEKAWSAIEAARTRPDQLYDYSTCLKVGDVWIHLECLRAGISAFMTANYKESQILCPAMGLTMLDSRKPGSAAAPE